MWIVDDDGDMFNTDLYFKIFFTDAKTIILEPLKDHQFPEEFKLSLELNEEERLMRYYDLVEKLTGERIDG